MMISSMTRNALILGLFAMSCVGLVVLLAGLTEEPIRASKQQAREQSLAAVMPPALYSSLISHDGTSAPLSDQITLSPDSEILLAKSDEEVTGIILSVVTSRGYSGDIELIIGIDSALSITGVRVTAHRETPGLGDKIDRRKSVWIESFRNRGLNNTPPTRWAVTKEGGDFDQFTGATITPRAVVQSVHSTLLYVQDHYELFFGRSRPTSVDQSTAPAFTEGRVTEWLIAGQTQWLQNE
jgi:Na+-translocating ferredoxin:NAD+ oxidoreductase subunit G